MRRSVRGLLAALGGVVLALGLLGGAAAAPSEDERAALYEVRTDLVEALRDIKVDQARYRSYRDDSSWYIVGQGFVDLYRLVDHVPIARADGPAPTSTDGPARTVTGAHTDAPAGGVTDPQARVHGDASPRPFTDL